MIPAFKRLNKLDGELTAEKLAARINEMQEELETCFLSMTEAEEETENTSVNKN